MHLTLNICIIWSLIRIVRQETYIEDLILRNNLLYYKRRQENHNENFEIFNEYYVKGQREIPCQFE